MCLRAAASKQRASCKTRTSMSFGRFLTSFGMTKGFGFTELCGDSLRQLCNVATIVQKNGPAEMLDRSEGSLS